MNLLKWKPRKNELTGSLLDFQQHVNSLIEDTIGKFFDNRSDWYDYPAEPGIDVIENDDSIEVKADMPGIDKKDIRIELYSNILRIQGERKEEKETKKKNLYRSERFFGRFERSITLPEGLDADHIKADYKNGVLEITIPKTEKAKPKLIKVN